MAVTQKHRIFAVNTSLGEDVLVFYRMIATEQLGRLFEYDLELLSERTDIELSDILGKNVTVRMELPEARGGGTRYFNGFVTRFSYLGMSGLRYAAYRATLSPWLWFLTRTSDCRIFQKQTVPEIIEQIFNEQGFSDFKKSLSGHYRAWEYCVQYRETDFNFVSRLMEQEGIYYYFKHENGKHTLVLADDYSAHGPFPSYSEVPYYPPDAMQLKERDHLHEWIIEKQVQSGSYELNDFDFEAPNKNLHKVSKAQNPFMAQFEVYDYPGEYTQVIDGENYAKIRLQELQAQHEILHGEGIACGLGTGYLFNLINFGREDQNREYLIIAAHYELQSDAYESVPGLGSPDKPFRVRITAIDARQPYRTLRITPKPMVQGPQTAIIVGPENEEIYTDQYGRVKCHFHWDRYDKADENSSCWIRVAQFWAGKRWGAQFLPRIGQEVIVDFLEGDPDQPIITGRVYNSESMPPYTLPDKATLSTIKSNSSKGSGGFNEFRFEDKKNEEQIFIHAQRRMDMRIRGSLYETNYGNREMRIGWEKDGQRGGDCNTFVQYDVNYHIKEGEYQKIDKQLHQTVVENVLESHTKNHTTFVTEKSELNAQKIILEGADQVSVKSGKVTIEGTQSVHIKAGQLNLEGQMGISLKVGGNFVVLDPSGVSINGIMVKINSGGSAQAAEAALSVAQAEIEEPIDAAPADDAEPGQSRRIGGQPRTRKKVNLIPQEVPPYKPPPEPPEPPEPPPPPPPGPTEDDTKCAFVSAKGKCAHGREIPDGKILEVVPAETYGSDEIQLEAEVKNEGSCRHIAGCPFAGGPVKWNITDNGTKNEKNTSFPAEGPVTSKFWLPSISPKKYDIRCSACGSGKRLTVHAYPPNQFAAKVDLKTALKMVRTITKAVEWALEFAPGVEKFTWKYLEGKVSGEAQWKEWTDHRAYYAYKIAIGFDPLFGAEAKASLGTSTITKYAKKIPGLGKYLQKVIDWLVKAGLYLKLSGGINVDANYERKSPDEKKFVDNTGSGVSGKIQVTLGGEGNVLGSEVIKVDINASAAIVGKGDFSLDDKGALVDLSVEFDGLKGQATVKLLWGLIDIEDTITFVDKQTLWGPKKFYFWES